MAGPLAASLGAIAMATVLFRGVFSGESPDDCILSGLFWLVAFSAIGWIAGKVVDYLIRQDVETRYRRRWGNFCQEVQTLSERLSTERSERR